MSVFELGLMSTALVLYCLVNAFVMSGLFVLAQPSVSFKRQLRMVGINTIWSIIIIYVFFGFIARLFCLTPFIAYCIECVCPIITTEEFLLQSTFPATILFFLGVSLVQTALIAIPQRLSPLAFVAIVAASNSVASLLKLGMVSLWLLR